MKLTKNFSLSEFTKSNTATRRGIDNYPTAEHIRNLTGLCEYVLQPLRDAIGQSIRISSGYRGEELNRAIGGSSSSDHCNGNAADIELIIDGKEDNAKLFNTIKTLDLDFYQLIYEFGDDEQPDWVHIARRKDNNKKQCLRAYKDNGKTKYETI